MKIPRFRPERPQPPIRRGLEAVWVTGAFSTVYLVTNHYPVFSPKELPMTALDRWVPLWPWASWIYLSVFAMAFLPYVMIPDGGVHRRYRRAFLLMVGISGFVFVFFPTVYPRGSYPVLQDAGASGGLLEVFRALDAPTNCAPSLHVGVAYLAAFQFLGHGFWRARFLFVWASGVWVSTLLTKQHYWVDGILGLGVAATSHYLVRAFSEKRR